MISYVDGVTGRGPYSKTDSGISPPDILMISFDMVPREFYLPVKGDLSPRTPNLDRLKQDGLFFSNAYAVSPLCSPSRAAIFTGRYPYIVANGERYHDGQQAHLRDDDTIFQEYLSAAGYRTRHFGKCHVGAAKFIAAFGENDSPWDRWSPPWQDDDGYREFLRKKGVRGFRFSREIRGAAPSGKGTGNFLGGWVCGDDGSPFPKDGTYPAYITGMVLSQLANGGEERRPLYLQVDYFEPHQPFFIPAGFEEREKELRAILSVPVSWESAAQDRTGSGSPLPLIYSRYRAYWGMTSRKTVEDYLVANVLQYEILDEQIGRIMEHLAKTGTYNNTMIILTADHGEMNCRDALIDKGAYLNPRVLQVPLYLKPPETKMAANEACPGTIIDRLCSLLDIAPTILASAGIQANARFDGRSLLESGGENRKLLAEVFSHVLPNPSACLIREQGNKTEMYTVNFADSIDEYYRRGKDGVWPEQNGRSSAGVNPEAAAMIRDMLDFFSADKRWAAYASFLKLIHAGALGTAADLQKFVSL